VRKALIRRIFQVVDHVRRADAAVARQKYTKSCTVDGFGDDSCAPAPTSNATAKAVLKRSAFTVSLFKQAFEPVHVVTDHRVAVHNGNGRGHHADFFKDP
jgi:hypothetical protein